MSSKNKIKYLILTLALLFLIVPKPASAILGTGLFDYFNTVLQGLQSSAGPVITWQFIILIFNVVSIIALGFITSILDNVILTSPQSLSVTHNGMVAAGWHFTAGIANLFIVLALIILAFGFILKIESLQARKTLPRLLIAALLLNFSLVFVGALVDVANILYLTIFRIAGPKMIEQAVAPLTGTIGDTISKLYLFFTTLILAKIIPITAPFAFIAKALPILKWGYIPVAFTWIISALLSFTLAGIFLVYAFIFTARIYIIQILAIVSPLIFLSWALPPLKKYWDEWLNHLLQWLFFGLILYFFMVIGLKMAVFLMPKGSDLFLVSLPYAGVFSIAPVLKYYFFIFIYLTLIIYFGQRLTPVLAGALLTRGAIFTGIATAFSLPMMAAAYKESIYGATKARDEERLIREKGQKYLEEQGIEAEDAKELAKRHKWDQLSDEQEEEMKKMEGRWWLEKPLRRLKSGSARVIDKMYEIQGTSLEEEKKDDMVKERALADKETDNATIARMIRNYRARGMFDYEAAWVDRLLDKNPGIEKDAPAFKDFIKKLGIDEKNMMEMDNALSAMNETKVRSKFYRAGFTNVEDLHNKLGDLPRGALGDKNDENNKRRAHFEDILNKLSEEDLKIMTEGIEGTEGLTGDQIKERFKEPLLRFLHIAEETEYGEITTANKEFMKRAMRASPHVWNVGHHSQGLQHFRNWYVEEINKVTHETGLPKALRDWNSGTILGPGLYYGGLGIETPGKADEKELKELLFYKQNFNAEQLKTFGDNVGEISRDEKENKILTEVLRENPGYMNNLANDDLNTIQEYLRSRETGGPAGVSVEQEIANLQAQIETEEAKERPESGVFLTEESKKKIKDLKARIRELKKPRSRRTAQYARGYNEGEGDSTIHGPKDNDEPGAGAGPPPRPPSGGGGSASVSAEPQTPTTADAQSAPKTNPPIEYDEGGARSDFLTRASDRFNDNYASMQTYNQTLPNYYKRQVSGLNEAIERLEKEGGVDPETIMNAKVTATQYVRKMTNNMVRPENVHMYDVRGKDERKHEAPDIEGFIENIKRSKINIEEVQKRSERVDKELTKKDSNDPILHLFSEEWEQVAEFIKEAEKPTTDPKQKNVLLATALYKLDSIEKGLRDEGIKKATSEGVI